MKVKQMFFWFHKQTGLLLALFFVVLGLTGSMLVFMRDIEPVIHPDVLVPIEPSEKYSLTDVDSALASFSLQPDSTNHRLLRIYLPTIKDSVYRVVTADTTPAGKGDFYFHYISPYNSDYLGKHLVKTNKSSRWSMPIMRLVLQVHIQLMTGYYGSLIVGLVGILFFTTLLVGFYLWVPKNWNRAFSVTWKANVTRLMLELHKQVGFWAGLVLLLISFTGIYHAFPEQFTAVVAKVMPYNNEQDIGKAVTIEQPQLIQSYVSYVNELYPDAKNIQIFLQDLSSKNKAEVRLSQPNEMNVTEGKTRLMFNTLTGNLIHHIEPSTTPMGNRFINWMLPIHNGEAFGLIGRIIFFIVGLTPLFLFISGFLVFYKKYQLKNKKGLLNFIRAVLSAK